MSAEAKPTLASYTHPVRLREQWPVIVIGILFTLLWWGVALHERDGNTFKVWDDQRKIYAMAGEYFFEPYAIRGYFNAPWTLILLLPFELTSLEVQTLVQTGLYFVLLGLVIIKFGGNKWGVVVALSSALAADTVFELSIDWIVCIGLLVPPMWSLPFLMVKPQTAFGYLLSFERRAFIRATMVGLAVLLASFVIWGAWPLAMMENLSNQLIQLVNLSPMALLPVPLSILIGIGLGGYGFWRRDPILSTAAGVFFVPYIAPNSVLLIFGLLSARWPRAMLVVNVAIWVVVVSILQRLG